MSREVEEREREGGEGNGGWGFFPEYSLSFSVISPSLGVSA